MFRSSGLRFIAVGFLTLLMFIPLNLVSGIIEERAEYSEQTMRDISHEWGGAQLMSGPIIQVPVTEDVVYNRRTEAVDTLTGLTLRDEKGNVVYEHYQETVTETRPSIFIYPEDLEIVADTSSQVRKRGIFEVPVYTAATQLKFHFDATKAGSLLVGEEVAHWDEAELNVLLSSNRALRGEAVLTRNGVEVPLEPISGQSQKRVGVTASISDPREGGSYVLHLTMNGARHFLATATGRSTRMTITSDWPDPSFFGSFLPDATEISDDGFLATWTVPHLARSLPQVSREYLDVEARSSATMGVRFLTPNDFYQKAYRSARYGILFIGLTFLTILLLDRSGAKPTHPVQYLMVGLAQSIFVLLMVAYAEQIGFSAAYLVAASATIGLLILFGLKALKMGRRVWVLGTLLITLYGVLFMILRSNDFALLAGSTLAFVALAGTMLLTRNEDWHGPEGPRRSWLRRKPKTPEAAAV